MHVLDTRQVRTGKRVDRRPVSFVFVFVLRSYYKTSENCLRSRRCWTCSRSGRSARRAGLGEARFVILQDSHIDLVLFVGFFTSRVNRQSLRLPVDGCGGAGSRTLHVLFNLMSCPPRLSQDLFFCMRYVRKTFLFLFCWRVEQQSDEFAGSFYGFHIACVFCCPFHGLLFHSRTRQFVLQCLTGVHGALDRRHHRCASGT